MQKLLTPPEAQPKTKKSKKLNVLTYALHLAPADVSGRNVCPMATEGCKATCLNTAGMGIFDSVQAARIRRTNLYFDARLVFMQKLYREIAYASRRAAKLGMRLSIRLNATSDIPWERVPFSVQGYNYGNIMAAFPRVQFYDYTKVPKRAIAAATRDAIWPRNYHLTFSLAENNAKDATRVLGLGGNVAAVFRTRTLVETAMATGLRMQGAIWPVIDGDATDARYLDKAKGAIVGLYAKGKAKRDTSGFVLD